MTDRLSSEEEPGGYVWRGGERIQLEEAEDRFAVMPAGKRLLEALRNAPGVREVQPVTNQVFRAVSEAQERSGP